MCNYWEIKNKHKESFDWRYYLSFWSLTLT
jgi:hypothetical protein